MADSLFDNRYRYDHIYPRGRSGETLRAYDTQRNDLPVVIKRPAPNDAPPIRAGQEVSILNERKALKRLAGHPVLTEFLAAGQFSVGGMPHQYIVMERAEGVIIADAVLERARAGERLPLLEALVIVDRLLDLLQIAHSKEIVYNDVDAKHLFWNRETYTLKVIDWGNAIFLEGDATTSQGISRQTDIAQVGQLLYFIFTGGKRADIPREANSDLALDFGRDAERVAPRLQEIISKAAQPNLRFRYRAITDLRRELTAYRQPMERERDASVNQVNDRLRHNLSKTELQELVGALEPALQSDPGYPATNAALREIQDRQRDLAAAANLDAARIYMEGGNWGRAADVLNELRGKTGPKTAALVDLLLDFNAQLLDSPLDAAPPAVLDAITLLFDEDFIPAARVLLTQAAPNDRARQLQWSLAERISSRIPDILLLRPNLYRLELALRGLAGEGLTVQAGLDQLAAVNQQLDALPSQTPLNFRQLCYTYQTVVDQLTALQKLLTTVALQHNLSPRRLPLTALERAINAAMALADNIHIIGKQAASSPRDAAVALDNSRAIDPTNPLWEAAADLLNKLYELLQSYQTYIPAADGSDLAGWLVVARRGLNLFTDTLADETLIELLDGLESAARAWTDYADAVVLGQRAAATVALATAGQALSGISSALTHWLNQLHTIVGDASYIERHALSGGLGRALADGWEAFDRGRLVDSERLAQQAVEIARNETERFAAKRLLTLSTALREWVERNGFLDTPRTQATLKTVESLFQPEELALHDAFAAQMPGKETYLKAMNKGLVEAYTRHCAPALRIFYAQAILLGALECQGENPEDARFWREVAVRLLGDYGQRHVGTRTLDDFIERRRDLHAAEEGFNHIHHTGALLAVETIRREIEANPRAQLVAPGIHSLHALENALRDWSDGEFRAAGLKLEDAIQSAVAAEQSGNINLKPYRDWLGVLVGVTAELHTLSRQMRQSIERRPAEPEEIVRVAHQQLAEVTRARLGETFSAQLRRQYETYTAFLRVYTDKTIRRSARLERFDELFKEMFIDRHPAYPLYRHWVDLTDKAPEFPAPPTDEPTPRLSEAGVEATEYRGARYADEKIIPPRAPIAGLRWSRRRSLLLLLLLPAALIGYLLLSGQVLPGDSTALAITRVDTQAAEQRLTETAGAQLTLAATAAAGTPLTIPATTGHPSPTRGGISILTPTLVISPTPGIRLTPLPETATVTPVSLTDAPTLPTATPTNTPSPSETVTPSPTPSPTNSPTPTLPPEGLRGWQDLLALTANLTTVPWDTQQFFYTPNGNWQLGSGELPPAGQPIDTIIAFPAETLALVCGNHAPTRIYRTDANLSLTTFNPTLLASDAVYFGLVFRGVADETALVGVYLQAINLNVVNFWLLQGEERTFITQRSINSINGHLRLERNLETGVVTAFFNDAQIGAAMPFLPPEAAIKPALLVRNGGVIVTVVSWRVGLR